MGLDAATSGRGDAMRGRHGCGWAGTLADFASVDLVEWLRALAQHTLACMGRPAGAGQIRAWRESFAALRRGVEHLIELDPTRQHWGIVFEYELPREQGRRPDVVVLTGQGALVLEFKQQRDLLQAHVDQVAAYARDLKEYHRASHDLVVASFLVLAEGASSTTVGGVRVLPRSALAAALAATQSSEVIPDVEKWLDADYEPLPTLVEAARRIFRHEPLPRIRRAASAGVNDAVAHLATLAMQAHQRGERHLALITGVPGAGKTLVGLQFVHQPHGPDPTDHGVFLSGNRPLVEVLQHALHDRVFVQHLNGFLKQYDERRRALPIEHIWVFDEAQRAWDLVRVAEKRGGRYSEPEHFLRLGERMPDWCMLVGLVGSGQEIYLGEEAGIAQWDEALSRLVQPWVVHCPPSLSDAFPSVPRERLLVDGRLSLDETLRSHLASSVDRWVAALLDGQIATACSWAERIRQDGFDLYVTRELEEAREYVRCRYEGDHTAQFGLLASSRARNLVRHGLPEGYSFNRGLRPAEWFDDPPTSPRSCCQLSDPVTEFQCQGLELELPIVCWGNDFIWRGSSWESAPHRSAAVDPHRLRTNSYRVLLTRGRDGMVVFVPPDTGMDATYEILLAGGVASLQLLRSLPA